MRDWLMMGGTVVWLCAGCGVVALAVFLERALHLHRARIKVDDFLRGVFNILRRGNIREATTICEETPGPVAFIAKTAILHRGDTREALRQALDDASLAEISRMERRLVVIATVAQTAPLLGLFGTLVGLAEMIIGIQNDAPLIQSVHVTAPLLKALASTAAGLAVAIPSYAAFNVLVVKIDRIVLDMERAKSELTAFFAGAATAPQGDGAQTGKDA